MNPDESIIPLTNFKYVIQINLRTETGIFKGMKGRRKVKEGIFGGLFKTAETYLAQKELNMKKDAAKQFVDFICKIYVKCI